MSRRFAERCRSVTPTDPVRFSAVVNKAFSLANGRIHEEVDKLRIVIGAGADQPWMRRSDVWKFFPRSTGTDFFVTSASLQSEMKGTVHLKRAHFGFNKPFREAMPESWIGSIPPSRLYHTLEIRDLAEGEYQHLFAVAVPGFALLKTPLPLEAGKKHILVDPHPAGFEATFGLTVVQGDWRQVAIEGESDRFVGLLVGERGRHALISVTVQAYSDPDAVIANMNRNLGLIDAKGKPTPEELSAHLWMERGEEEPIRMIELHGIQANKRS